MNTSDTTIQKLLSPCPRCLTVATLHVVTVGQQYKTFLSRIECECRLLGPTRNSVEKAIAAWNVATEQPIAAPVGCECINPETTDRTAAQPTRAPSFEFNRHR
jgi:hypothetical protein